MQLPAFTAAASLESAHGVYVGRLSHGGSRLGIEQQLTPRPGRPGGRPRPFPPFGPFDDSAQPTYCDTFCLDQCRETMRRGCEGDALCVLEVMPVCRNHCCAWGH